MNEFLRRLLDLVRPYKTRLLLGVVAGVVAGVMNPLLMIAVRILFNLLFPTGEGGSLVADESRPTPEWVKHLVLQVEGWLPPGGALNSSGAVLLAIASIPGIMFLRGAATYLNLYFLNWAALRAINDLRERLFTHLQGLSLDFFNKSSTGELISRIYNDTFQIHGALTNSIGTIIAAPITILSLVAYLVAQQPKLTLISLTVMPLCVVPIAIYSRKVRRASEGIQQEAAMLSSVLHEAFTGVRVIKSYNLEAIVGQQFAKACNRYFSHWMRAIRAMELPGPLIEFFGSLGVALIFLYIARVAQTPMKAGDFLSFVGSLFLLYQPIKAVSRLHSELQRARASSQRVFELLETKPSVHDPVRPLPLRSANAAIQFENIDFDYGDKAVLRGIHLTVEPGEQVALVGASGSGKTTLTNLLLRFYDAQRGAVKIGGTDIRQVALRDLRNQIAVVTQETILFNDTIRHNIALGRPGASDEEIEAAARKAHAHEFILEKPHGYDTAVGEKGMTLSGGQRQRLAIARAILKNAPILVLDEATSALDTESERAVQSALEELMRGRTTICIAHRLSTIQRANLIVVLDHGRIVETGTHAGLIQRDGIYRKLHELQFQA